MNGFSLVLFGAGNKSRSRTRERFVRDCQRQEFAPLLRKSQKVLAVVFYEANRNADLLLEISLRNDSKLKKRLDFCTRNQGDWVGIFGTNNHQGCHDFSTKSQNAQGKALNKSKLISFLLQLFLSQFYSVDSWLTASFRTREKERNSAKAQDKMGRHSFDGI